MVYTKRLKVKIKTHKNDNALLSNYLKFYFELRNKSNRKKTRTKTCIHTKNNRGIYSFFNLSRHSIKQLAALEQLPGVTKSSW